jgi:hypothetical protein
LAGLITALYLLRQQDYGLNKNVRLVSWRILQHEQISRHRRISYRMIFSDNRYAVSHRAAGSAEQWKAIASYPYENSLRPTLPGFEIVIENGAIVSCGQEGIGPPRLFPLLLGFSRPQEPARQKGILIQKDGSWKIQ